MSVPSSAGNAKPVAVAVDDKHRETFLPTLFGHAHFFVAETVLYRMMEWLSPEDYGGGYWAFNALDGKPLYLVPPERETYRIVCATNGYSGEVSPDAAGIIATLFTLSHLSFKYESDHLSLAYHCLYEYAAAHPEASAIFGAID